MLRARSAKNLFNVAMPQLVLKGLVRRVPALPTGWLIPGWLAGWWLGQKGSWLAGWLAGLASLGSLTAQKGAGKICPKGVGLDETADAIWSEGLAWKNVGPNVIAIDLVRRVPFIGAGKRAPKRSRPKGYPCKMNL